MPLSRRLSRFATDSGTADARRSTSWTAGQTDQVLDATSRMSGRLDGLVCTPSINVRKKLLDYTEDEFDRVVRINLKGSFNVVRAAGRLMIAQQSGSIVIFSSIRSAGGRTRPGDLLDDQGGHSSARARCGL